MNVVRRGQWQILPEIVPIVLNEIARLRECGQMPQEVFEQKLERLAAEESRTRGCDVVVKEFSDGTLRFAIRERKTGETRELIECIRASYGMDGWAGAFDGNSASADGGRSEASDGSAVKS